MNVIIYGSQGKMGQALLASLESNDRMKLVGEVGSSDPIDPLLSAADAVIDFTNEKGTSTVVGKCLEARKILVSGTTSLSNEVCDKISAAAKEIPIVFSPNYSVGVNTLFWLTKKATEILGPEYDSEVIDIHHRFKKDAPSGAAQRLAKIIAEARHLDYEKNTLHGRSGMVGARTPTEIGVHSLRAGDVIGEHTVLFGALGERLELTHRASNREIFAHGALRAAMWAYEHQKPGLYDMQDVLGLK